MKLSIRKYFNYLKSPASSSVCLVAGKWNCISLVSKAHFQRRSEFAIKKACGKLATAANRHVALEVLEWTHTPTLTLDPFRTGPGDARTMRHRTRHKFASLELIKHLQYLSWLPATTVSSCQLQITRIRSSISRNIYQNITDEKANTSRIPDNVILNWSCQMSTSKSE